MTPHLVDLTWQLPAIFTAVPMVHRLVPFKIPQRALPLFYFIVSLVVMLMPGRVDLALGAAGLISMLHIRLGENLANAVPPDMKEVANRLALAWDHIVISLPKLLVIPVNGRSEATSVDDSPEDSNPDYAEPPSPPEHRVRQHIPRLD